MSNEINTIVIGDTQYELDHQFLSGMLAARQDIPYTANPIATSTNSSIIQTMHDQWDLGHEIQSFLLRL